MPTTPRREDPTLRLDDQAGIARDIGLVEDVHDGAPLVFSARFDRAAHLNPGAALIWQLVDGSRTAREIARALIAEVAGEEEAIVRDVETTLATLAEHGFIDRSGKVATPGAPPPGSG